MFIKGFDENLRCRGYQFEVGKVYDTGADDKKLELCSNTVFHFCRNLEKVHNHYSANPKENNRFCEIEVLGRLVEGEEKCGSNKIKIVREITGQELANLRGFKNGNTGLFNTGNRNTGNRNTGNRNTGNWNTGDWNTGDWNTCNRSTGLFNTKESTIYIFNKDSGLTWKEVINSNWYRALYSGDFILTEWIYYTEEEKENSVIRQCIGGYLKKYTFKEACENWWKSLDEIDRKLIQTIPNFDKSIFKEITGIEV